MSRPSVLHHAWAHADCAVTAVPARMVPLRDRNPRCILMIIDGDRASLGYAIYRSGPDGEWCIEGPMDAEEGVARAQVLSTVARLPIILSRRQADCS